MKTIWDYLHNRLSPEEDEQLTRQLFRTYFSEVDGTRQQRWAQLLSENKGIERRQKIIKRDAKKQTPIRWIAILAAAGATALLLLFIGGSNKGDDLQQQVQAYIEVIYPESEIRKGEAAELEEQEILARLAYNEQRFAEAELLWQRLSEQYPTVFEYKFLQALSALYQPSPNYEEVGLIMEGITTNSRFWGEQARWYLALIRLKQNRNEDAQLLLRYIIEKDDWKSSEAAKLLERLDDLYF